MSAWKPGDPIVCRFCGGTNCETGDDCNDCGCPRCNYPGARYKNRGFCPDCEWEAVPGAYKAWRALQPKVTPHQAYRQVMGALGADLPPDDEVGQPLYSGEKA